MYKKLTVLLILLLLTGNIYFYLKSSKQNKIAGHKVSNSNNNNTYRSGATSYTYEVASYNLSEEMTKVENNSQELNRYALKNKCNAKYAFVIDMRIPSYKKRFFIFDFAKDSIINAGYVAHGTGSETFKGNLIFSNVPDSRCTSLGKYKIGASYKGMYGFSYRLMGLDSTNNKALERAIVLHGHSCVPDKINDEYPLCFSYGCPMVSPKFLQILKGYISKQGKTPILLSIIY